MTNEEPGTVLPCWARIAIMGHIDHVGYVSEIEMAGAKFLKVEPISREDGTAEPFILYRPENLYSFQPTTEESIRQEIEQRRQWAQRRQQIMSPPLLEEADADGDDHTQAGEADDEEEGAWP